jgi:hypothetical protein
MNRKILCILTVFTWFVISDVGNVVMAENLYEWLPTESADYNYPMQIIEGKLIFKDKNFVLIPGDKVIGNGWGETGSIHLIVNELKPIPENLTITWFSFTEDKFYSGTFDLPYEKIRLLFEEGFIDPVNGKELTYSEIIVGLAPEGEISVWLSGRITTEIGNFQAKVANMDWVRVINKPDISRKDYIKMMLDEELGDKLAYLDKRDIPHSPWRTPDEIAKTGIHHGLWKMYREKYLWVPVIAGINKPTRMWIKSFNGENNYIDFPLSELKRKAAAVPRRIKIDWKTPAGGEFTASIIFDEQEIFQAFQKFSKSNTNEFLTLQIEIGDRSPSIGVSLKNSDRILKLASSKIKVNRY